MVFFLRKPTLPAGSFILIVSLFLITACGPSLPGGRDPRDLDRLIREDGSTVLDSYGFSLFSSSQRRALGDETSLGVALLLRDSGRRKEARAVLRRIVKEGAEPWHGEAVWELSSLLQELKEWEELEFLLLGEPSLLEAPALRDRLYTSLASQGKLSVLQDVLLGRGESRPLLTASAAVRADSPERGRLMIAAAEAKSAGPEFISLAALVEPEDLEDSRCPGDELILAKSALHQGEYAAAEKVLLPLLDGPVLPSSGLLEDIITLYRKTGRLREGARRFDLLAKERLDSGLPDEAAVLAFAAGRLFRWAGMRDRGSDCFLLAHGNAPPGEEERYLWYLLDSLLGEAPLNSPEILTTYAPLWKDPSYHEDLVDRLYSRLLSRKAGGVLAELAVLMDRYGSRYSRAQGAYILGRLEELGWVSPGRLGPVRDLYGKALSLDPTGWYGWLARYRLGDWRNLPGTGVFSASSGRIPDLPLELYLDLSMVDRAQARWARLGGTGFPEDKYNLTSRLQDRGRYLDSIRFIGGVGASDPRRAWELRFPRGYRSLVESISEKYRLPAPLVFALVRAESGFTAEIESWAGAVGLAQIMPATAIDVASRMNRPLGSLTDPYENLELGGWYLRWLIEYVGEPWSAVLAYNGGPGRVRGWLEGWNHLPPDLAIDAVPLVETRNYGRQLLVSSLYYGYLYYGIAPEGAIDLYFGNRSTR